MIARTMVQVSCPPHMRETKPRSILMRLIGNGGRHDGLRRRGLSLRDRHAPHRHDRVRGLGRAFRLRRGPPRRLCLEGRAVHGRRLPAAGHRRRRARRDFHSRGRGSYLGTVAGVILITLLQSIPFVMQMPEAGRQIIYGGRSFSCSFSTARAGKPLTRSGADMLNARPPFGGPAGGHGCVASAKPACPCEGGCQTVRSVANLAVWTCPPVFENRSPRQGFLWLPLCV